MGEHLGICERGFDGENANGSSTNQQVRQTLTSPETLSGCNLFAMHDVGCPISFCLILLVVTVSFQSNLVRASPSPYPNELEEIAAEKRAWNNFHWGYGKRAWNNFNGGYGKRASIAYDYDEHPDREAENLYDIEDEKRAWNSGFNGGLGKRAWNNFNGGYGKRAWNNFSGGYGKRAWNSFSGGYGKRSAESLDEGEVP